jgi:hypothetical protein
MVSDTELSIRSFNQVRLDHPCYIVPAFIDIPVCESLSMHMLKRELRIRRKTIERARVVQSPGSTFHFGGTKNRTLICVMLASSPEALTFDLLRGAVSKAIQQTIEGTAVIGDGFRLPSKVKNRDDVQYGFELLCRVLRRRGFTGTVYEPPEYLHHPDPLASFPDEQSTDTHTIIKWDGSVSASIPPTMLKLLKPNSD